MSYFSHLECSVPCGAGRYDPAQEQHLCTCGAPLLARYDLERPARGSASRSPGRAANMWRYRELMPLFDGEEPMTLGEGWTPLIHARAARRATSVSSGCSSRTNRSIRPTRSRRADSRPR